MAHPSRSNPALRSSSDGPFACITPSTETCVVVVSFMIEVPHPWRRPPWAAFHPCNEHLRRDPTPPPDLFRGSSGTPVARDRQRDGFGAGTDRPGGGCGAF